MAIKERILDIISNVKNINIKTPRYDDIREELQQYGYENLVECMWNILNDFPICLCKECGNRTKFGSFKNGYAQFCDIRCSNKFKGKDESINKKISNGMSNFNSKQNDEYWENRANVHRTTLKNESIEHKESKKNKKSETLKNIHSKRTSEEKDVINNKISVSMLNSEKAREQRIRRAKLGGIALNNYKKTLTDNELKEYNKKLGYISIDDNKKEMWDEYYRLVWYYTNKNLKYVNNIELRGIEFGYSLDHKYSIKQGFLDEISADIIGSHYNLEIITISENSSKGAKCSITKEELISLNS